MRFRRLAVWVLGLPVVLSPACGGRAINKSAAQRAIVASSGGALRPGDVDVLAAVQTGPGQVVAESDVRVAFALEKTGGEWQVREVRVGGGPWHRLADVIQALDQVKAAETRKSLLAVAAAIDKYRAERHSLPDFEDFVSLADRLSPQYLTPLVRLDAWLRPLFAFRTAPGVVRLVSAGPDGKLGTQDDIEWKGTFPP